jgi:predicted regulator of Ras-like GTPase activity (Roadblock/LC7/MglB family)
MRDRRELLERLLHELAKHPGVLGAALVSRDGLAVQAAGRPELHRETFSAMSATVMGAAEIAFSQLSADRLRRLVAETDSGRLLILGATPDLLLLVYARPDVPIAELVPRAEAAAASVASVAAG